MKQNISLAMNVPNEKIRTVPRYSDKFKDVLERALKKQSSIPVQPKIQMFFYRLRSAGVGAFSFVYLVCEEASGSIYAQKSISKKKASPQLLNQIKMHFTLHHPNIIQLYHIYSDEDYVHLIMEYAGDSLFSLRKNKTLPLLMDEPTISMILRQIVQAVAFIHSKGLIHADLKLENVLYLDSVVKVCDFGFTHLLNKGDKEVVGTMEYLSPEYVQGNKSDCQRDIWALGIIAYQLLTGTNPLEKLSENQKWSKMLKIKALPEQQIPTGISEQLRQFFQSTLCTYENRKTTSDLLKLPFLNSQAFQRQQKYESQIKQQILR